MGSAFVPRRVPKFKDGDFDGFDITHYALLLGCKRGSSVDHTEFEDGLPHDRLQPFHKRKFVMAVRGNNDLLKKNISSIDAVFYNINYMQLHDKFISFYKQHQKKKLGPRGKSEVYKMYIKAFRSEFKNHMNSLSFLGDSLLYSKDPVTGFWVFDESKADEDTFQQMVNADMPNWIVAGVRDHYKKETLVS